MARNNTTVDRIQAVWNKLGGEEGVERFLRGDVILIMASVADDNIIHDNIIHVDRSVRPSYPNWVKEVLHPELEVGPVEYDITTVEQWLHDGQKDGKWVGGYKILTYLEGTDTLKICFNLQDLEEIRKKGVKFFRRHFKGKVVFGWASVARSDHGHLNVPFLYERGDEVVMRWNYLDDRWDDNDPALRHASSTQV